MTTTLEFILVGIFLPLFPFSMVLNVLYGRIANPVLRSLVLLLWPQFGIYLLYRFGIALTHDVIIWALLSSLLYAVRALVLRELGLWTSFIATSAWALLWVLVEYHTAQRQLQVVALGISLPLVLMALLSGGLERRYGAAYLGLYGGLAQSIPRFAGILSLVVLAVIATPVFPGFFAMLSMILKSAPTAPLLATGIGIVWLLWSWAGARLLQGLIAGPQGEAVADLSRFNTWLYIFVLVALAFTGVYYLGIMGGDMP